MRSGDYPGTRLWAEYFPVYTNPWFVTRPVVVPAQHARLGCVRRDALRDFRSRRRVFFRPRSASKGGFVDEQSDLYRRIDELLSRPTDEQVREQRALNDLMVSVRDAIARLTGDVAALSARVSETREYA